MGIKENTSGQRETVCQSIISGGNCDLFYFTFFSCDSQTSFLEIFLDFGGFQNNWRIPTIVKNIF